MRIISYDDERRLSINEIAKIEVVFWDEESQLEIPFYTVWEAERDTNCTYRVKVTLNGSDDNFYIDKPDNTNNPINIDEANKIILELLSLMNGDIIDLRESKYVIYRY